MRGSSQNDRISRNNQEKQFIQASEMMKDPKHYRIRSLFQQPAQQTLNNTYNHKNSVFGNGFEAQDLNSKSLIRLQNRPPDSFKPLILDQLKNLEKVDPKKQIKILNQNKSFDNKSQFRHHRELRSKPICNGGDFIMNKRFKFKTSVNQIFPSYGAWSQDRRFITTQQDLSAKPKLEEQDKSFFKKTDRMKRYTEAYLQAISILK